MSTYVKLNDNSYFNTKSIALSKNKILSDTNTLYTSGCVNNTWWFKFSNGVGIFIGGYSVAAGSRANSAMGYKYVFSDSTNTSERDKFIPNGIKFVSEPKVWMFASNADTPDGTEFAIASGASFDKYDQTNGYVPNEFTAYVSGATDDDYNYFGMSYIAIGNWKTSSTTDSSNTFFEMTDGKLASDSIAFDDSGTTLKDIVQDPTIEVAYGDADTGGVIFSNGLALYWTSVETGTMTATMGKTGYIKSFDPHIIFPYTFSSPPAIFASSKSPNHVFASTYGTTENSVGTITFTGENSTTSTTCHILAIGTCYKKTMNEVVLDSDVRMQSVGRPLNADIGDFESSGLLVVGKTYLVEFNNTIVGKAVAEDNVYAGADEGIGLSLSPSSESGFTEFNVAFGETESTNKTYGVLIRPYSSGGVNYTAHIRVTQLG